MTARQLIDQAYRASHWAGELTANLYDADQAGEPLNQETVTTLLEQARGLNSAAQALELIARKHPEPVNG